MNFKLIRDLYPCPDCGVDSGEFCLSRKDEPMERFIHPNRSLATRTTLEETVRLRDWLRDYSGIFEVPA